MPPAVTFQVPDEEKEDFEDDHGQTTATGNGGNGGVVDNASASTGVGGAGSTSMRPSLAKSVIMTPSKSMIGALLKLYIFVEAFTEKGLNHFNNVYFVTILGWSPFKASWVWFARDCIRFLFQTVLSAHIDRTEDKKKILYLIAFQKLVAGIIMVTTSNFVLQVIKGATDGFTTVAIWPCVTAMTLGVVGKTRFHKKHAGLNMMVQYVGTFLSVLVFGAVAYVVYPNLQNIFYQNVVVAVLLFAITLLMPPESETVDHQRARGRSVRDIIQGSSVLRKTSDLLMEYESDDEDEGAKLVVKDDENVPDTDDPAANPSVSYTKKMTVREMYSDPGRGRSLVFLSLVYFGFHLVNATVLPLFGQLVGLQTPGRLSVPAFTGILLSSKFNSFVTTWFIKGRIAKIGYRNALFVACFILAARCISVALVGTLTDNPWILAGTLVLNGQADAIMLLMLSLYSHLLSRKTGRFNLNMGIVSTFETIGSALSILLGGALATKYDYPVVFVILSAMVALPILCIFGIDDVALTKW